MGKGFRCPSINSSMAQPFPTKRQNHDEAWISTAGFKERKSFLTQLDVAEHWISFSATGAWSLASTLPQRL